MTVFSAQIALAQKLVKKYGAVCTWITQNMAVNSSQPWKTTDPGNPTQYTVSIVLLESGQGTDFTKALQNLMPGTSVPEGFQQGLMAAVPFSPAVNDKVVIAGVTKFVKAIDLLMPDGTPILYTLTFA